MCGIAMDGLVSTVDTIRIPGTLMACFSLKDIEKALKLDTEIRTTRMPRCLRDIS